LKGGERLKPSKRFPAPKKERKKVLRALEEIIGASGDNVEHVEFKNVIIYVVDGLPAIIVDGDRMIPHLIFLVRKRTPGLLPKVYVDPGATRAVGRGADLMVPGITRVEGEFEPGILVVVVDESTGIPIAIGEALMSSGEIRERLAGERRGKALRIVHRPGDRYWKMGEAVFSRG